MEGNNKENFLLSVMFLLSYIRSKYWAGMELKHVLMFGPCIKHLMH